MKRTATRRDREGVSITKDEMKTKRAPGVGVADLGSR